MTHVTKKFRFEFQKLLGKSDYKVFPSLTGSLFECIGQFLDPSEDNPVEFCKEQLPPELQNSNTTKEDESLFNSVTDALQEFWLQLTVNFDLIIGQFLFISINVCQKKN